MTTTYRCVDCGAAFQNGWQLHDHRSQHHPVEAYRETSKLKLLVPADHSIVPQFLLPRHQIFETLINSVRTLAEPGTVVTYIGKTFDNMYVARDHAAKILLRLGWPFQRDGNDLLLSNNSRMAFVNGASPETLYPHPIC